MYYLLLFNDGLYLVYACLFLQLILLVFIYDAEKYLTLVYTFQGLSYHKRVVMLKMSVVCAVCSFFRLVYIDLKGKSGISG